MEGRKGGEGGEQSSHLSLFIIYYYPQLTQINGFGEGQRGNGRDEKGHKLVSTKDHR